MSVSYLSLSLCLHEQYILKVKLNLHNNGDAECVKSHSWLEVKVLSAQFMCLTIRIYKSQNISR